VEHSPPLKKDDFPSSFVWKQEWVRDANWKPSPDFKPRPKSSMRDGLKYENTVGKILLLQSRELPFSEFLFQPSLRGPEGVGIIDHLLLFPSFGIIFETKLTLRPQGLEQIKRYAGLAGAFYQKPFFLVMVCKSLSPTANGLKTVDCIADIFSEREEGPFVWHISWPERVYRDIIQRQVEFLPEP
jgi:hypothetical protein